MNVIYRKGFPISLSIHLRCLCLLYFTHPGSVEFWRPEIASSPSESNQAFYPQEPFQSLLVNMHKNIDRDHEGLHSSSLCIHSSIHLVISFKRVWRSLWQKPHLHSFRWGAAKAFPTPLNCLYQSLFYSLICFEEAFRNYSLIPALGIFTLFSRSFLQPYPG